MQRATEARETKAADAGLLREPLTLRQEASTSGACSFGIQRAKESIFSTNKSDGKVFSEEEEEDDEEEGEKRQII